MKSLTSPEFWMIWEVVPEMEGCLGLGEKKSNSQQSVEIY